MNTHYFMKYRAKFFAHYESARVKSKSNCVRNMESKDDLYMMQAMSEALVALTRMGLEVIDASLLANLVPPDPMEPTIGIMADVRAYFQGSYHITFSSIFTVADSNLTALQRHTNDSWTMSPWGSIERCCGADSRPRGGVL